MSSSLTEIVDGLLTERGLAFNKWIAKALNFLFLEAKVIEKTQSESDVIAEALLAEEPYYIVVEGQAVLEHNEVGYDKLGQIRGSFPSYMDERRQKIFKNAYKLVVGRPRFSKDARNRAEPDVVLISVEKIVQLLKFHEKYRFSQDDLEILFRRDDKIAWGEIDTNILSKFMRNPFQRRIEMGALVLLCLGANREKREWMPIQQVVGIAKAYGRFLKIRVVDEEVMNTITDLQSTLLRLIERQADKIRLQSFPMESISSLVPSGTELFDCINNFSKRLKSLEKASSD